MPGEAAVMGGMAAAAAFGSVVTALSGLDHFKITVNMVPLIGEILDDIESIVVNQNRRMPSMCEITLYDQSGVLNYKHLDSPQFRIGSPLSVAASPASSGLPTPGVPMPMFSGEIVAIEVEYDEGGSVRMTVRAYDKTWRLHRGKKSKAFQMQPDNLIIQTVCSSAGLVGAVSPTGAPHEYVLQTNQSDWDFVQERARINGMELYVNELGVLACAKPLPVPGPMLKYPDDIIRFRVTASAAGLVGTTKVTASDPKLKIPIMGVTPRIPLVQGGTINASAATAIGLFGAAAADQIADEPMANMGEATARAAARAQDLGSEFITADGTAYGNPGIKPGSVITMIGMGLNFNGPYRVTSATHSYRRDGAGAYETHFSVTGHEDDSLRSLLNEEPPAERSGRINGVVIGKVTNNMDPLQQNRVQLQFMWLGATPPVQSPWARVCAPDAGMMRGILFHPEVGDEVLVAFEQGDPNFPYVIGRLWNNLDRAPAMAAVNVIGGKVSKRIIQSRSGHKLIFDDTPGAENITLVDKTMMNSIEIDSKPGAAAMINLKVTGNCNIEAQQGDITLKSLARDVSIDCVNFNVKAKAQVSIEGNIANFKGQASANIESGGAMKVASTGPLQVQSNATAQLSAQGPISVAGKPVDINNGALTVLP